MCVCVGGGGTLIFSYVRRLGLSFWGSIFGISMYLGVFRKMNILLGMNLLWMIFWGHHKIGLYLGVISMHFRVFS